MLTEENAVSAADREAILDTARDYIESWLDGDPDRMADCLHPELIKRCPHLDPQTSEWFIETLGRTDMVTATGEGRGTKYERPYEASLLDAYGDIANVALLSSTYMDYLQVVRTHDRWRILNVVWQRRPVPEGLRPGG